jgi:hypothetical protein
MKGGEQSSRKGWLKPNRFAGWEVGKAKRAPAQAANVMSLNIQFKVDFLKILSGDALRFAHFPNLQITVGRFRFSHSLYRSRFCNIPFAARLNMREQTHQEQNNSICTVTNLTNSMIGAL